MSERHRKYCKSWRRNNPEYQKHYSKKWNKQHPDRDNGNSKRTPKQWRAHNYIETHPELLGSECELCGTSENLVSHHPDYNYPKIIITCCASCHNFIHKGVD